MTLQGPEPSDRPKLRLDFDYAFIFISEIYVEK